MSVPGENAQPRATAAPAERLEWQSELDSALADIDTRLKDPRRRVSDSGEQPMPAAESAHKVELTSEQLDEIAHRVAEQIRRTQTVAVAPAPPPPAPVPPERERTPQGIAVTIRIRKPLFRFRFWRRRVRRESLISFSDYRIT